MTNKPMLSVDRELLERLLRVGLNAVGICCKTPAEELRALLDEPDEPFNLQGWSVDHSAGRPILMHNKCSVIEAEQAYGLLNLIETAAQHQGDTVERLKQVNNKQWRALIDMRDERDTLRALLEEHQFQYKPYYDHYHRESGYYCVGCGDEKGKHVDNTCDVFIALSAEKESVVAEQPAPVSADIVHDRAYRDGLKRGFSLGENGRIDQYQKEFDSYQREILQESKGNAAPVAVVMPDFESACGHLVETAKDSNGEYINSYAVLGAQIWESARLNGAKP